MLHIDSVVIEITRECNLQCEHCLRGKAEKGVIPLQYVNTLFKQISNINTITLTGGEPALYPTMLINILNVAKKYQVQIDNFYLVTNGTIISDAFLLSLMKWYLYCDDNEVTQVDISNDMFHDVDLINKNWKHFSTLSFIHKKFKNDYHEYKNYQGRAQQTILSEGRGKEFTTTNQVRCVFPAIVQYTNDDTIRIEETDIYLNIHGKILNSCDLSYASQDHDQKWFICDVQDLTVWMMAADKTNSTQVA